VLAGVNVLHYFDNTACFENMTNLFDCFCWFSVEQIVFRFKDRLLCPSGHPWTCLHVYSYTWRTNSRSRMVKLKDLTSLW
jgi:hypothetical protein